MREYTIKFQFERSDSTENWSECFGISHEHFNKISKTVEDIAEKRATVSSVIEELLQTFEDTELLIALIFLGAILGKQATLKALAMQLAFSDEEVEEN